MAWLPALDSPPAPEGSAPPTPNWAGRRAANLAPATVAVRRRRGRSGAVNCHERRIWACPRCAGPGCARRRPRYDCGQRRRAPGAPQPRAAPPRPRGRAGVSPLRARIPHATSRAETPSCARSRPGRRESGGASIRQDSPPRDRSSTCPKGFLGEVVELCEPGGGAARGRRRYRQTDTGARATFPPIPVRPGGLLPRPAFARSSQRRATPLRGRGYGMWRSGRVHAPRDRILPSPTQFGGEGPGMGGTRRPGEARLGWWKSIPKPRGAARGGQPLACYGRDP